jgi:3-oxoacyl-[acyl-carrier-protein] synthase III
MATKKALDKSYLQPNQIDLLIYVGIGRGFLEPGNSYLMAKALGFNNAECFDIIDACMSWMRAISVVDSLFKTGKYKNALVINAEFNMTDGGPLYPKNFSLANEKQIEYTFPSFTIGEAASACLLIPKESENFKFHFSSRPDLTNFCTIPLPNYKEFCHPEKEIGKNGPMQFTSYGMKLHEFGGPEAINIFKNHMKSEEIDIAFVHASSQLEWDQFGKEVGIDKKMYHIYPDTGNLVSASIPTAISISKEKEILKRGDKVACWVGSAGMSFGISNFIF